MTLPCLNLTRLSYYWESFVQQLVHSLDIFLADMKERFVDRDVIRGLPPVLRSFYPSRRSLHT